MDIRSVFAKNVRIRRKAAHLSQEKLAEKAGMHRTYIGGVEQRRVNASLKSIEKIAAALEVDPAVLFLDNSLLDALEGDASKRISAGKNDERTPKALGAGSPRRRYLAAQLDEDAPRQSRSKGKRNDDDALRVNAALCTWDETGVSFRPIAAPYDDLTVHVLCDLINQGYTGEELYRQYLIAFREISDFLDR